MTLQSISSFNVVLILQIHSLWSTSYLIIWKKYMMNWIRIKSLDANTTLWNKQTSLSMSSTSTLWSYSAILIMMIALWWTIFRIKSTIICRIFYQSVQRILLRSLISRNFFKMWIINSESTISYAANVTLSSSNSLSYLTNTLLHCQWWLW